MRRALLMIGCALLLSGTSMGATETWSNVSLVDTSCAIKSKDHPDAHMKACALQCAKAGFGVIAGDGTFLKFDAEGNSRAVAALKGSTKADHLRVTVAGDRQGDTIKVTSLRLE